MSNNKWLKTVNELNRQRFSIPAGWETKERVAEFLQCDPAKVNDLLKAGIDMGRFERNDFSVWDDNRRMTVRVTCYRLLDPDAPQVPVTNTSNVGGKSLATQERRIKTCLSSHPDWDDARIAKSCKCKVGDVRTLRSGAASHV
jgi:hypothetical protein